MKKRFSLSEIETREALQGRAPVRAAGVELRALPHCGKINLRGDANDTRFVNATADVFGAALPLHPGGINSGDNTTAFWLAPDEWLVHCDATRTAALLARAEKRMDGMHFAATDVGDYYAMLALEGEMAAEALARGCALDLHPRVFAGGQCMQTRFGHASVLLIKPGDAPLFRVQVRWSFAAYLWEYLAKVVAVV